MAKKPVTTKKLVKVDGVGQLHVPHLSIILL